MHGLEFTQHHLSTPVYMRNCVTSGLSKTDVHWIRVGKLIVFQSAVTYREVIKRWTFHIKKEAQVRYYNISQKLLFNLSICEV